MNVLPRWWRRSFLQAEFGLALLITLALVIWVEYFSGRMVIYTQLASNRTEIYAALAAIFGALLGFAITTESIVLGFSQNERLEVLRQSPHYPLVWRVFSSAIKWLGVGVVVSVLGLALDGGAQPRLLFGYAVLFVTVLASFRVMRCVWVLDNMVKIVAG